MTWAELYSEAARPTLEEIDAYAHTPLWPHRGWSTAGAVWSRDGM